MGLFGKIKELINPDIDMGYDDDDGGEYVNGDLDNRGVSGDGMLRPEVASRPYNDQWPPNSERKIEIVPKTDSSVELKVVKPENFDYVTQIADFLLERKTVVLNLEDTNRETARRLIDFLQGVAYAINGQMKKAGTSMYIVTPRNVDVTGEQITKAADNSKSANSLF